MISEKEISPIEVRYRFSELDRILIEGVEYTWDCDTDDGMVLVETKGYKKAISRTRAQIAEMMHKGKMTVNVGYHHARDEERRRKLGNRLLGQIEDAALTKALWRQTWCDLMIEVKSRQKVRLSSGKLKPLMERVAEEYFERNKKSVEATGKALQVTNNEKYKLKAPAAKTLRDWCTAYIQAGCDVSALFDGKGGNPKSPFTPDERQIHARFILKYASRTKPSIAHLHRRMKATINRLNRFRPKEKHLRPLGETWFREKINALPDFFKMAGRDGERKARQYFQVVLKGMPKKVPMQRLEADEWCVDLQTILIDSGLWYELTPKERKAFEKVRLWLSGIIDTTTKCIVALRIYEQPPSINTAFETLEMTSRDKTDVALMAGCRFPWEMHGGLRTIGTDSATWYVSPAYRATLIDAGCSVIYPPSGEAYLRGTIERFFRTIAQLGLQEFSGQTFSNVVEKGDNDPEAEATVRKDLLINIFIRLIVDVYHNAPHAGIGGMTPRQAWREMTRDQWPTPPLTGHPARDVFGIPHRAKVTRSGINFHGIQYWSEEIHRLRMDDKDVWVDFRLNPRDLSWISVSVGDAYLPVPSTLDGLEGISFYRWVAAAKQLRIYDREQLDLVQHDVDDALEWAAKQADVARAEMGLGAPTLDLGKYEYLQEKVFRHVKIRKAVKEQGSNVVEKAKTSPELSRLFGAVSRLAPKKKEKVVQETNGAERRRKPAPVVTTVPASYIPPDDDEFASTKGRNR
ncbi:Mu transposase C-terminal domain-containing protein [Neorhizobium galegae]|uniref:Mu transposase C-terminal domain-containing protein n=1 Tax=Neorhizobium galegae TaxID=399 RepID=UPI0021018AAB|nr:Mu transposase C-terminal domain-containing protein [Neorhizobium galegae]MCQ1572740.1 Mu transposase C-terminal domain-containing protein [Neorhizobium galegae]